MKVLVVDLNNFAKYPPVSVGYSVTILREEGNDVKVFSLLALGVSGVSRESKPRSLIYEWLNYRFATPRTRLLGIRAILSNTLSIPVK